MAAAPIADAHIDRHSALEFSGINHAFFTRQGGISTGIYASLNGGQGSDDAPGDVTYNRSAMAATLGVDLDHLVTPYQVHSPDVLVVDGPWPLGAVAHGAAGGFVAPPQAVRPRVDALVTARPGVAVGVTTADCASVLFCDPTAGVVAAAHAGWRGALDGVLGNVVRTMITLGAAKERIVAVLGPCISQPNYEVGPEFRDRFVENDPSFSQFFSLPTGTDRDRFDLPGFVLAQLTAAGIQNPHSVGRCTYADPDRYYSYRRTTHAREPDYGRHISAIVRHD